MSVIVSHSLLEPFRCVLISACALCLFACGQSKEKTPPQIQVSQTEHNFGQVLEPDTIAHTFVVHNTGGDTLVIDKVKPGGGGGWTEFDRVIAPGDSGQVLLGISGKMVTGEFRRIWSIHCNDPYSRKVSLALAGEKLRYVTVLPRDRVYLRGKLNEEIESILTIASHDHDPDFRVESISSTIDDKITYRSEKGSRVGEWEVYISRQSDYRIAGSEWGLLTLLTNHPIKPERQIQVNVKLEGEISVEPSTIQFGHVHAGRAARRETVVVTSEKGGLKLTGWKTGAKGISAKIEEIDPGKTFEVHITFAPPADLAEQSVVDMIYIDTNVPEEPTISVRVTARGH